MVPLHILSRINPVAAVGYAASLTVFVTFCMTTMLPLRLVALLSNVLFISYGWFGSIYPVLLLHVALLPVNVWRLMEVLTLVRAGRSKPFDLRHLRSVMSQRLLPAGEILFHRGDSADAMFLIESGELEVVEFGMMRGAGEIIGEMGVLSRGRRRTATVRAHGDCVLLVLTASKARELWFQEPAFAWHLTQLLCDRLVGDATEIAATFLLPQTPLADRA